MIKSFRFEKKIMMGRLDPKRQYETELFEAVSDTSMKEAIDSVMAEVKSRERDILSSRSLQNGNDVVIETKE